MEEEWILEAFLPKVAWIQRRCILLIFFICVVSTHGLTQKGFIRFRVYMQIFLFE